MAPQKIVILNDWHNAEKSGLPSLSLCYRGLSGRIVQRNATFHLVTGIPGGQFWRSLRTTTRGVAVARATQHLKAMRAAQDEKSSEPLPGRREAKNSIDVYPMSMLTDGFMASPGFDGFDTATQADYQARIRIICAGLGDGAVDRITRDNLKTYAKKRKNGGIKYMIALRSRKGRLLQERERITKPIAARSLQADLKLLRSMIAWARENVDGAASRLSEHAIDSYAIVDEKNKKRPVATHARYVSMRAAAQESYKLDPNVGAVSARRSEQAWLAEMFDCMLTVLEGTGRRAGAILAMRWDDCDLDETNEFARASINFTADADKTDNESTTPVAPSVASRVRTHRENFGSIETDLVFCLPNCKPITTDRMSKVFVRVEKLAGLRPLDGGRFHPYRRKFAVEHRHLDKLLVMQLMGLKDIKVFAECYALVPNEDMRKALAQPVRLTDVSLERSKRKRRKTKPAVGELH